MNSDAPATPSVLAGRYKFVRTIARGGMSIIYLAQDIRLDRPVAVKVLFAGLAHNPAFVERFRREARSAAKLNHPHIVKVYDSGQDGNIYFIVMEYLEGMSLSEVLRREGSLGVETSMKIAEDVAEALSDAHKHGVIHRDIKPGNIIFVPSAGLKVADFGIARAISGSVSDLTQAGTVMGTATYFSPEQAKGESVDYRTDLYSLGVVLQPMEGLAITVDAYRIDIEDQIFLSENLGGTDVDAALVAEGVTGVQRVRFFLNGVETETEGVDVVARYRFPVGGTGDINLSAACNYTDLEVVETPTNAVLPDLTVVTRDLRLTFENAAPDTKFVFNAGWENDSAGVNLRATRFGKVLDPNNNPDNDFFIESEWIIDLSARINVTENFDVAVGADNVLDRYPTVTPDGQNFSGIFPYSTRSPFGFSGRFLYARLSARW